MEDERIKQALLRAWTRAGESFFSEVLPLLQQGETKKSAPPRKRLTKKKKPSPRSGSSSEEEAYNPPPLHKKKSPSTPDDSDTAVATEAPKAVASQAVQSTPSPVPQQAVPTAPAVPQPPQPTPAVESSSEDESMEEEKSVNLKDFGLSSSSSSSASPEAEPAEENQYASLTFCNESILQLLSELVDVGDEPDRIKRILAALEGLIDNFTGDPNDRLKVLKETNVFQDISRLKASFPPTSYQLCEAFKNTMRSKLKGATLLPPTDSSDEWRRLEKQLQDRIKRKSDTEVLATLRRIDDLIPPRLEPTLVEAMTSFFRLIHQLQTEAKHSEVQKKAGALYRRWKELQSPEVQNDQRKSLEEKIPGMYKKAKIIKESEGED